MATTIQLGPLTRIEGHLDVIVTVDNVNGRQQVVDATCGGTMFRGFENILVGRDPYDASHLTQRICGVCPISHGMAASLALEAAQRITPPTNGRVERNLVLGANFVQSHILHFYHLAALDYIDTTGLLDMAPWTPRFKAQDMVAGANAKRLVTNYVTALAMRRKAHQMGAIFGAKLPVAPTLMAGGNTEVVTSAKVTQFRALLAELTSFVDNVYLKDVQLLASVFQRYYSIGKGPGNLLAYGVFDLNSTGTTKLLKRGTYTAGTNSSDDGGESDDDHRTSTSGTAGTVDVRQITEYVGSSWYTSASGNLNPASGKTVPSPDKPGAYSWLKAPRYQGQVYEVGPLARMWVNGDYRRGISVLDRIAARAAECSKIAHAMTSWLSQLASGQPSYTYHAVPTNASGIGLTEAPRGALGHWTTIANKKTASYQVITPTAWNASPRDDRGRPGAIEQALIGTPVADTTQPIEVLRVVHSFDPCLACSVHLGRPGEKAKTFQTIG